MATINYIDLTEFRERGYLQELNRQFLHPLGMALEWSPGTNYEDFTKMMGSVGYQYGDDAMHNAWAGFCMAGGDKPHLGRVWDSREDEEGYRYARFPADVIEESQIKADVVATEQAVKRVARERILGYHIQPVSDFGVEP